MTNKKIQEHILNTLKKVAGGVLEFKATEVDGELYYVYEDKETGVIDSVHVPLKDIVKLPCMGGINKKFFIEEIPKQEYIKQMINLYNGENK